MGQVIFSQEIKAKPEQVWAIISDVTQLPAWAYKEGRFPYTVEGKYGNSQTEGVGTIWIGISVDGQKATQKVTVWQPPKKLAYELQEMDNAPLKMTQVNSFDLAETPNGTKVTWQVDWELTGGFSLTSLLLRFTGNGSFEEMMAGSLENLARLMVDHR